MGHSLAFLKKISRYLIPYKATVFWVVILSILTAGVNLLPLQIMATFVDIVSQSPKKSTSMVWIKFFGSNPVHYILIFAVVYFGSGLIMQFYSYIVSGLGLKICEDLRSDAFLWATSTKIPGHCHIKDGDIVTRIINDTDTISDAIVLPLRGIVVSILELFWALALLYTWSPLLSIVAFCIVPILYLLGKWSYLQIKQLARSKQNSLGNLTDVVSDFLITRSQINTLYRGVKRKDRFAEYNQKATLSAKKVTSFFTRYWPVVRFVSALGVTLTISVAYTLLKLNRLAPEDIMVAYLYCLRVYDPILDFTRYNMMISSADAALGRVLELQIKNIK